MGLKCFWRYRILYFLYFFVFFICVYPLRASAVESPDQTMKEYVPAEVLAIVSDETDQEAYMRYQEIRIKVLEGRYRGEILTVSHTTNMGSIYKYLVEPGNKVLAAVKYSSEEKALQGQIMGHLKYKYLLYFIGAFLGLLLMLGGGQGLKSIITLLLTFLCIIKLYIPFILKGYNPIILSITICSAIIIMCFPILGGLNKKTLAAIISTIAGIAVAGALAYYFGDIVHLTGISGEDVELLSYTNEGLSFDFKGILMGGIIMGSLGAIMDVSMSIASAMFEIESASPKITTPELMGAGMNIGRDIMGTMSNTLILAYIGNSINLILVFLVYKRPLIPFVNMDEVAAEVIRAMAGSIGLIMTIPITTFVKGIFRENFSVSSRYSRERIHRSNR